MTKTQNARRVEVFLTLSQIINAGVPLLICVGGILLYEMFIQTTLSPGWAMAYLACLILSMLLGFLGCVFSSVYIGWWLHTKKYFVFWEGAEESGYFKPHYHD